MMRVSFRVIAGVIVALAAAPGMRAVPVQEMPQGTSSPVVSRPDLRGAAEQIFALGNQARAEAGIPRLVWDPALAVAALAHCRRMAAEGPIAHRYGGEPALTTRAAQAGAHFSLIEENVAVGATPEAIHQAWMQSPGHRQNLLNPQVDHVGIAVVSAHGVLYVVADYTAAAQNLTAAQVEARVAALIRVSGVAIRPNPAPARAACVRGDGWSPTPADRPAWMIRWQNSDLSRLPSALTHQLGSGSFRQAAVGSCPAEHYNGAFTSYRVAVLLYY